jgi:predicted transcriptional regulator
LSAALEAVMKKKSKSPQKQNAKLLTKVELELMKHLWEIGEGTVKDVIAALPGDRKLAYTSVSTILRILEQKGILQSRKQGRAHIYTPTIARAHYETNSLINYVKNVFDDTPAMLVKRLLDTETLSADDIEEIKKMLDEKGH